MDVRTILLVSACSGLCLSSMNLGHREKERAETNRTKRGQKRLCHYVWALSFLCLHCRADMVVYARAHVCMCVSIVGFVFVCVSFGGKGGGGSGR